MHIESIGYREWEGDGMTFAEMIAVNREKLGISRQEFAKKCGLPVELITYLEDPDTCTERFINQCASALGMKVAVFTGEEQPELSYEEKVEEAIAVAKFPKIRNFLCGPSVCVQPEKAISLFSGEKVSIAERNLILYLSTTALYNFCDSNSSILKFDEYLFNLHSTLFTRFVEEIGKMELSEEERQDRIDNARRNIFACDSMENIAIRIIEPFAQELERYLPDRIGKLEEELGLPFKWDVDDELLKIKILSTSGSVKDEIKLLTVKERVQKEK